MSEVSAEPKKPATTTSTDLERRAMAITRRANLVAGLAGAVAAWSSNSHAVLMDGLLSLVGYVSAVFALRISQTAGMRPDRNRPFGYAADEALYATFRSLALMGLVSFGIAHASLSILDYFQNGTREEMRLLPIAIYTALTTSICFWLAYVQRHAWQRTGRQSDMLRLESLASFYDGLIALLAGGSLLSTALMANTIFEPIAPIMDSIVLIVLSTFALLSYLPAFRQGIAQLAGAPASSEDQIALRRIVSGIASDAGGEVVDIAAVRLGRKLDSVVYYDPKKPVTVSEIDALTLRMDTEVNSQIGTAAILLVVSRAGRDITKLQTDMAS
ncbi:MAG: cation transporter [Pseudomonadota bacterium]